MMVLFDSVTHLASEYDDLCCRVISTQGVVGTALRVFLTAHFYLSCFEHMDEVEKYPVEFSLGAALNVFVGNTFVVRRVAQIILATHAFLLCQQFQKKIAEAVEKIWDRVGDCFPLPNSSFQVKGDEAVRYELDFSPLPFVSTLAKLPSDLFTLAEKVEKVVACCFQLLKALFYLSRSLLLLFETIIYERYTQLRAITGCFIYAKSILDQLSQDRQEVAKELVTKAKEVDQFLELYKTDMKANDLFRYINESSSIVDWARRSLKQTTIMIQDSSLVAYYLVTGRLPTAEIPSTRPQRAPII